MKKLLLTVLSVTLFTFALASSSAEAAGFGANPRKNRPTLNALFDIDKKITQAWVGGNFKFFDVHLSDNFVSHKDGFRMGKSDLINMVRESRCEMSSSNFSEPRMTMISSEVYVVTYRASFDGKCFFRDGTEIRLLSPVRASSVYVRNGKKWLSVFHSETAIKTAKESKNGSARPPAQRQAISTSSPSPSIEENKVRASGDLGKIHQSLMMAIGRGDGTRLKQIVSEGVSLVNSIGQWFEGRNTVIGLWKGLKCEKVAAVDLANEVSSEVLPNVQLLTVKTSLDGQCSGQSNNAIYQTAIYSKVRSKWRLSFLFESPAT